MTRDNKLWDLLLEHNVPTEVISFMKYSRGLNYEETPDYEYLFGLLRSGL
jgi:hypothetical protein